MITRTFRGSTYNIRTATANSQTLVGTPSTDWIETLGGNNTVATGNGNDVVLAGVDFLNIGQGFGGDAINWRSRTDAGNNTISTGDGNDYVVAGAGGNDIVDLGAGDDIFDSDSSISVFTKTGNDIINAGAGNDIVFASGTGNKTVIAGVGNDKVSLFIGAGNTIVDGGEGDDRISVFDFGNDNKDIHKISAGTGDDIIRVGSSGVFTVDAGAGKDFIDVSGIVNGTIDGSAGNDDIFASFATGVKLLGGDGNDLIVIDSLFSNSSALGGNGDDTLVSLPFIIAEDENGPVFVPPLSQELRGGVGNDTIISGIGSDTIYDDAGNDIINLRGGFINLQGRTQSAIDFFNDIGTDKLQVKGGGNDIVYLGAGRDTILLGKESKATIYGFTAADKLDLGGIGINLSRNSQGNTIITTNDAQQLELGTLIGYTGQVSII